MASSNFDLSIFKDSNTATPIDATHNYLGCEAIKRLLVSLRYYDQLDIKNNTENHDIFCDFMDRIYQYQIHDDYHHFAKFHQNELEAISKFAMEKCSLIIIGLFRTCLQINIFTSYLFI